SRRRRRPGSAGAPGPRPQTFGSIASKPRRWTLGVRRTASAGFEKRDRELGRLVRNPPGGDSGPAEAKLVVCAFSFRGNSARRRAATVYRDEPAQGLAVARGHGRADPDGRHLVPARQDDAPEVAKFAPHPVRAGVRPIVLAVYGQDRHLDRPEVDLRFG